MLKTLTYPGTIGSNQYTYDTINQLKTYVIPGLAANNNTLTYQYRWNAIKEITMPGNLKRTITLDPLQRPERILVKSTTPTIPAIMDHRYQYDEVSNIKKKTTLDGDYVYGYDELDRLTAATPPLALQQSASNPEGLPVESYDYDPVHNRMSSAHQPGGWVYNANNELSEWGLDAEKRMLSYDENGSTVKEELGGSQITDYVYDAQDRLVEVKKNNSIVAKYAYDPMGRRVWREAEGTVSWFLYSDEGLIQEISGANQVIRTYGWNPGGMWGTDTVWQNDANGTFLTHNDHLYTTDVLTKADDGNKAWGAIRESFGKTAVQAGNQTEYLMRFPGQWEDEVSEFSDNYFRGYDYKSGLYYQVDPLINIENAYSYTAGGPNSSFDNLGLFASKLGIYIHKKITREAIQKSKWNERCQLPWQKEDAIEWSNNYDAEPGSQLVENAHTHAMSQGEKYYDLHEGVVKIRRIETKEYARQKMMAWISENLNHYSCKAMYLGFALHTIQDYYAPGHADMAPWDGGWSPLALPSLGHIVSDSIPSDAVLAPAIADSVVAINIWIKRCNTCPCD